MLHPSFPLHNPDLLFVQYPSFFHYQHQNPNLLFIIIGTLHPSFFIRILIYYLSNTHLFFIISVIILIYYSILHTHLFHQNSDLLFVQLPSFFLFKLYSTIDQIPIFFSSQSWSTIRPIPIFFSSSAWYF